MRTAIFDGKGKFRMLAISFRTNCGIAFGRFALLTAAFGFLGILSGCGGGGASHGGGGTANALSSEQGLDTVARSMTTRAVGTIQPPIFATNGSATLYGLFGASFTTVRYDFPNPTNGGFPLIGTGGKLGTGCAGFLISLGGNSVNNAMAFDTVNTTVTGRSAVRVTQLSEGETKSPALVVSIKDSSGGNLSTLRYIPSSIATAVVSTFTLNANEALVAFGSDGRLLHVIPFAGTRPDSLPASRKAMASGDVVTVTGPFKNIWDGAGNSIAPEGATSVQINTRTGALVGWD